MDCPKCGRRMGWYIDGLIRPAASTRVCPSCGAKLELLNSNRGLIINSILAAGGLLAVWFRQPPWMWLWISLIGLGYWLLLPVWTKMFGRLAVSSYSREQQVKARWLAAESFASTIMMGAWVFYMVCTLIIPYGQIISAFGSLDDKAWARMEQFTEMVRTRFVSPRGLIELGFGIVSFSWCRMNIRRRMLLRRKAVADKLTRQEDSKPGEGV